jgi:hypothetical protein
MKKIERWWADASPPSYYSYLPTTGEFVGVGRCDPSPLEPGVWLVPGCATRTAPPATGENEIAVFNEETKRWRKEQDHRGEVRWIDGEFREITSLGNPKKLGIPDMVVHDAEYFLPEGAVDETGTLIRMWINDDVLTFPDDPNLLARRVLAGWEAQGETIRPVEFNSDSYELEPPPLTDAEIAKLLKESQARDEAAFNEKVDKRVQEVLEGR